MFRSHGRQRRQGTNGNTKRQNLVSNSGVSNTTGAETMNSDNTKAELDGIANGVKQLSWRLFPEDMPSPRWGFGSATDGERYILVAGGSASRGRGVALNTAFMLDTELQTWTQLPNMRTCRLGCTAAFVSSTRKFMVIGGADENETALATAEAWDGTKWTLLPHTMKTARCFGMSAMITGARVVVVGGTNKGGKLSYESADAVAGVEMYDFLATSNRWKRLAHLPKPEAFGSAVVSNGDLIVLGGRNMGTFIFRYSVHAGRWHSVEESKRLNVSRDFPWSCVLGDIIVCMGGYNPKKSPIMCETTMEVGSTTLGFNLLDRPELNYARYACGCAVVGSKLFVFGGTTGNKFLSSVEVMNVESLLYDVAPTHPCMPTPPAYVNRQRQKIALTQWITDAEKALVGYRKQVQAVIERNVRTCNEKVNAIQQEIDRLQREMDKCKSTSQSKRDKITADAQEWIEEQETLISEARETVGDLSRKHKATAPALLNAKGQQQQPPAELICPITLELMKDPVIAADGHTYERHAIQEVFSRHRNPLSPCTNLPLESKTLVPNVALRSLCNGWSKK